MSKKVKDKGISFKLMPKQGEGCYLAPLNEESKNSAKFEQLKRLLGDQYFSDKLPASAEPNEDVKIEEIEEEAVDIDIDPENLNNEEFEVIKALYEEKDYEEIEDDFVQQANLDDVLEEYKDESDKEDIVKVSKSELEAALNEFIVEHKPMFHEENIKIFEFEGIPFEKDHVLHAALMKSSSESEEKDSSEEEKSEDDVVSNASYFTNTDNRPEVISIRPGTRPKKIKEKKEQKEEKKGESGKREKGESKEEKKKRKEKIKAEKKETREEKKKKKVEKKIEKIREAARNAEGYDIRQGTSVFKLG